MGSVAGEGFIGAVAEEEWEEEGEAEHGREDGSGVGRRQVGCLEAECGRKGCSALPRAAR